MSESAGPGGEKLDLFSLSNLPADWVPERDSQCVRFVRPFIAWLPDPSFHQALRGMLRAPRSEAWCRPRSAPPPTD